MSPTSVRLAAVFIAVCVGCRLALAAGDLPSAQVETVPLHRQEIRETVTAYGTVTTSEESMSNISFSHSGQITALHVRAGQKVRSGDPLVTISADPAALLSFEKAEVALEFAKRELARQQVLRAQHLAINANVASAQKAVTDATAALETEHKLGNDQRTEVATAPFKGYVTQLLAAPGDRLQANTVIVKLARTDQGVGIAAGLKPEDAEAVTPGMPAVVTPILSASQPVNGTVRQIGGTMNAATKLIDVWIDVPQADRLVHGTAVSVEIVLSSHDCWVVPRNAVLHDDEGSYIFQITNGHAKRVNVTTGIETGRLTEITGDFDPSLEVAALGNYELRDGMAAHEALPVAARP